MKTVAALATIVLIAGCSRTPLNNFNSTISGTDGGDSNLDGYPERDGAGTTGIGRDSTVIAPDASVALQEVGRRDSAVTPFTRTDGFSAFLDAPSHDIVSPPVDRITYRPPNDGGRPNIPLIRPDASPILQDAPSADKATVRTDEPSGTCSNQALLGHTAAVSGVTFSPDGQFLASAASDHLAKIWRVSDGALVHAMTGGSEALYSVAYSPDGQMLATGGADLQDNGGSVRLWRSDGTLVREVSTVSAYSVAFSPDGKTLASGHGDDLIRLWSTDSGQLLRSLAGHTDGVTSVAFTPNGATLASASFDATVRLWDISQGTLRATLATGNTSSSYGLAISRDGTLIASLDVGLLLWSLLDNQIVRTVYETVNVNDSAWEPFTPDGLAFTPDGQSIVTAGPQVWIFSVSDGSLVNALGENTSSVAVSPDGTRVAAGEPQGALNIFCLN